MKIKDKEFVPYISEAELATIVDRLAAEVNELRNLAKSWWNSKSGKEYNATQARPKLYRKSSTSLLIRSNSTKYFVIRPPYFMTRDSSHIMLFENQNRKGNLSLW